MKTELINGYLHEIKGDHSESETQEEELTAEKHLAFQGVPINEIRRLIIDSE